MKFLKNWTIDPSKIPAYATFKSPFTLDLDQSILNIMSNHKDSNFNEDRLKLLQPIISAMNGNQLKIKHNNRFNMGRFYANNSISPICVSRHIKHTLFHYLDWVDIDMVKGHPSILYSIAKNNGIELPTMKMYLDNPDSILKQLIDFYSCENKLTTNDVKGIFNIKIYGGNHNTWIEAMGKEGKEISTNSIHPIEAAYDDEIKTIINIVYLNNKAIADIIKGDETNEYKIKNKVMSYFCGTIENEILYITYKFLVSKNIIEDKKCALEYDGLCFKKPDGIDMSEIILELNHKIKKDTNLDVKMKLKGYDPEYVHQDIINERNTIESDEADDATVSLEYSNNNEINKNDSQLIAENDEDAATILLNIFQNRLVSFKGRIFYKNGNIWIHDIEKIKDILLYYILQSNIGYWTTIAGFVYYCKNITSAKRVLDTLLVKVRVENNDPDLYNKFHKTTKNRICFKDGVLDFNAKRFYTWSEIDFDYYTTIMINMDYKNYFDNPDFDTINDIKTKIFNNMYGNNTDLALHFLSRAIAGNYEDKNFATYLGNRDSGKGVQYDILKYAFEDYVSTFELGNLLYNRMTSGMENVDCSKKLYWLIDLEFVRLAISQEIPEPSTGLKCSSKMLKKISGGGDTIVARRNYDRVDTHFTIDTTFYMLGNNSLEVDNNDCNEHRLEFNSVNQFKSFEEIEYLKNSGISELEFSRYKLKDKTIKDNCNTDSWKKAVIYLLFKNYSENAVNIIKPIEDMDIEDGSILTKIQSLYKLTYSNDDYVLCSDLNSLIGLDKKKIENELQAVNIFKKKCSKSGPCRLKYCYYGLLKIAPEEEPTY